MMTRIDQPSVAMWCVWMASTESCVVEPGQDGPDEGRLVRR